MLQAYLGVVLDLLALSLLCLRVGEGQPVLLVTVLHVSEFAPVVPHDLFVVMVDEGLENLGLFRLTSIYLGEQGIDE